ncbi:MAG: 2-5 ligase [Caulobacter sp.]|nr:2-5 ligase [Caulobacter sp.]
MAQPSQDERQLSLDLRGGYTAGAPRRRRRKGDPPAGQRAFFALMPDDRDRLRIAPDIHCLCDTAGIFNGRRPDEIWHISLAGIMAADTIPDSLFEQAGELVKAVTMPAFDVAFDRIVTFGKGRGGGPQPVVLLGQDGVMGVRLLQQQIVDALMRGAEPRSARTFEPHMTVAYSRTTVEERAITPIRWRAASLVLVQSFVGQTRYAIRGRWPLKG